MGMKSPSTPPGANRPAETEGSLKMPVMILTLTVEMDALQFAPFRVTTSALASQLPSLAFAAITVAMILLSKGEISPPLATPSS